MIFFLSGEQVNANKYGKILCASATMAMACKRAENFNKKRAQRHLLSMSTQNISLEQDRKTLMSERDKGDYALYSMCVLIGGEMRISA